MKKQEKILRGKVEDYKRFAFVLLAVSGFLYFGAVIPTIEKTVFASVVLMVGTVILITSSTACLFYAKHCQKLLSELDEDHMINR